MPKAPNTVQASVEENIPKEDEPKRSRVQYPGKDEQKLKEYISTRVSTLKEFRKKKLSGLEKNIENVWREADNEYPPHELGLQGTKVRFESDEDTGLRSRLVKVGQDTQWQANQASPDLYVKISTALSILNDQNPEAVFLPAASKYEANTKLAYGNWKNSWEMSGAKQTLKHFMFNLAKYGTAFGKTYPKIIETQKTIRVKYDEKDPSKDEWIEKRIVKYNDLCRESLNPWQVWVNENARVGNTLSVEDWYYEQDYSWDKFKQEFGEMPNVKSGEVKKGSVETDSDELVGKSEKEGVTVGFYENQLLDLYIVWCPSQRVILYASPLPNDDGKLSLWYAPWSLRHDNSIYGIGLFEIIRGDLAMYDRFSNMTMDQLTLSIYKMFFHKGIDQLGENGKLVIEPGVGEQVIDPAGVKFLEVPGPGSEAWNGLQFLQDRKDHNSGVPKQLSGTANGNTLGQDLQAKEAALERMKMPLDYILDALQEEAYITLSWQKQILSLPEILEWSDVDDLKAALEEWGLTPEQMLPYMEEIANPTADNKLAYQEQGSTDDEGQEQPGRKFANVYKEVAVSLEQDDEGELIESEERKFYRFGVDLPLKRLEWKGIIRVKPQSILAPSKELTKRQDLDMFNLVFPSINAMASNPLLVPVLLPPLKQIVKTFDKNIKDWLNVDHLEQLFQEASQPQAAPPPEGKMSLSVKFEELAVPMSPTQKQVMEKYFGIKVVDPLFVDAADPLSAQQDASQIEGGIPAGEPTEEGAGGAEPPTEAPQVQPVAQLDTAPNTLGGAVGGATMV